MLPIEQLEKLIQGKKVAFIGAGVSHKRCIEQFVELGAQVTLCDQKKSIEDFGDYADTLRRLNVALSLGELLKLGIPMPENVITPDRCAEELYKLLQ